MLHQSLLPVHKQFAPLLANLRYVVVDEGHAYRYTKNITLNPIDSQASRKASPSSVWLLKPESAQMVFWKRCNCIDDSAKCKGTAHFGGNKVNEGKKDLSGICVVSFPANTGCYYFVGELLAAIQRWYCVG